MTRPVAGDRLLEVDVEWFGGRDEWPERIAQFVATAAPLLAGQRDVRAVVLNVAYSFDPVLLYTGDLTQVLPLHRATLPIWSALTYRDLRDFLARLRSGFADRGLHRILVGPPMLGYSDFSLPGDPYDFQSEWKRRHPETYFPPQIHGMTFLDLTARLVGDDDTYASAATGIPDGLPLVQHFGRQWGRFAQDVGFDLIHLREGFCTGPLGNGPRVGSWAGAAATESERAQVTRATIDLFAEIRAAAPDVFLMGYGSGFGATAELIFGGVDIEQLIAAGAVDAWVEQTWAGAFQDFWGSGQKGWTFQLAYLMTHAVLIHRANAHRPRPCRHYVIVELVDTFEPWNTVGTVPAKLAWSIWVHTLATTLTETGPRFIDGHQLSWLSDQGGRLVSQEALARVHREIDDAWRESNAVTRQHGPVLRYDRKAVTRLSPRDAVEGSVIIEQHAAMLLKWGVPMLSAAAAETALPFDRAVIANLTTTGTDVPVPGLVMGRADLADREALDRAGVRLGASSRPKGYYRFTQGGDEAAGRMVHLQRHAELIPTDGTVRSEAGGVPLFVTSGRSGYWQPPDLADPTSSRLDPFQLGCFDPYVQVSAWLSETSESPAKLDARQPHETITFHTWETEERLALLFGNVESGYTGDSRWARTAEVIVDPREWIEPAVVRGSGDVRSEWLDAARARLIVEIAPDGFCLVRLRRRGTGEVAAEESDMIARETEEYR